MGSCSEKFQRSFFPENTYTRHGQGFRATGVFIE